MCVCVCVCVCVCDSVCVSMFVCDSVCMCMTVCMTVCVFVSVCVYVIVCRRTQRIRAGWDVGVGVAKTICSLRLVSLTHCKQNGNNK